MLKVSVLYGQPQDPAAFDKYYNETHTPLALKMQGLKGFTVGRPTQRTPTRNRPIILSPICMWI